MKAGRKERNKGPTPPHYLWTYGGDNPIKQTPQIDNQDDALSSRK